MKPELVRKNLQKSILFKDASEEEVRGFAEASFISIVPKGEFVYRQGDASDTFYVIALGEAELYIEREGGRQGSVGRIGAGGHFGETSILTGKPRSLSVRALFDLVLICFSRDVFQEMLLTNPAIHRQLGVALAERLQVSFLGQLDAKDAPKLEDNSKIEDALLHHGDSEQQLLNQPFPDRNQQKTVSKSKTTQAIQRVITDFSANNEPYLLTGEEGTGKKVIARQVHAHGETAAGMYIEVDLRGQSLQTLPDKLFGQSKGSLPFFQMGQTGILEQACGGTVVFLHAELMPHILQRRILNAMKSGIYFRQDSDRQIALQCRLVFVGTSEAHSLKKSGNFLPELWKLIHSQHYHVPSLREHKRDLPRFIEYYLDRYNREYGKNIKDVARNTLGMFMNYDWPGNLSELSSVIQRAVMLSKDDEKLTDEILLGLPKTEGKWEFNLLRIPGIRKVYESRAYPLVPQIIVGAVLLLAVFSLFFGPREAESNIGITLAWSIGWPLLFFSFFILARTWCSVCTLATPGTILQSIVKPKRKTPKLIKDYSGWIMSVLCVLVLWVEIVWNAYKNPVLSGFIILAITVGSIIFSLLYSRRAWCRYLCPLGAINAIFAMPSILELRSNRHLCLNNCTQHLCFRGTSGQEHGCPMFQHPFMVDNNHNCIVCGKCIKNCQNKSIHLNLRLAPTELWGIKVPRMADTFLIVSLSAIFFPFAMHDLFYQIIAVIQLYAAETGVNFPAWFVGSVLFFLLIALFQGGYFVMVKIQRRILDVDEKKILPFLGYGFIPMVLGGFLAAHFEIFVSQTWRLVPNIQILMGEEPVYRENWLLSPGATGVIQMLIVLGGLSASMYAIYRISSRLKNKQPVVTNDLILPYSFLIVFSSIFLFFL